VRVVRSECVLFGFFGDVFWHYGRSLWESFAVAIEVDIHNDELIHAYDGWIVYLLIYERLDLTMARKLTSGLT
jgi:hypothetical protein